MSTSSPTEKHLTGASHLLARLMQLVVALTLFSSAGVALQTPSPVERELTLDPSRIALRGISLELLAAEGIAADAVHPWPIADWFLADLPAGTEQATQQSAEASVRGLVERLAAQTSEGYATPVFVGLDGGPVIPRPVILTGFQPSIQSNTSRAILGAFDELEVMAEDWAGMPGAFKLRARVKSGYQVMELAGRLAAMQSVRYSEPSMIFTGHSGHTPNEPNFGNCWGLHNTGQDGGTADIDMNGPEAWDVTLGDASVRVVIIDTGVQQNHPDIQQIGGTDLTTDGPGNGGPVNSFDNHGTAVAGCVSATIDNSLGTVGIAPGCRSASARTFITLSALGDWTTVDTWTVDALSFAESVGARVTNNSNSYGFTATAIADKYQQTRNAGMVHFASAGNESNGAANYPSSLPSIAAISAIDRNGNLAGFSNFGPDILFAGPGVAVYSTDRTGADGYDAGADYASVQGTSFASPYVAGVAALLLSHEPALDPDGVEAAIRTTAKDLGPAGFDNSFGWGLPDVRGALDSVNGCPSPTNYCTSAPNSVGAGAVISWTGTPDPAMTDFHLVATGCPAEKPMLFFYGQTVDSTALGNGTLCIGPSIFRFQAMMTDVAGEADMAVDFSQPPAGAGAGEWLPGDTWFCQGWYRDPAAGGAMYNLTDGLEVKVCAGSNTYNGMESVPAGTYGMGRHVGGGLPDELPVHNVTMDAFYMDTHEVTTQQYADFLNLAYAQGRIVVWGDVVYQVGGAGEVLCDTFLSSIYGRISWDGANFGVVAGAGDRPMVQVSWYGACAYANGLSRERGLTPCYDETTWDCDFAADGFRLPTEAEWEYAARGGEHSPYYRYPWGDAIDGSNGNYFNSGDAFDNGATPVGYYDGNQTPAGTDMANGYGLYDMSGNVWEWCGDWYGLYPGGPQDNPTGPNAGVYRVLRGGGWSNASSDLRTAARHRSGPPTRIFAFGFRVVAPHP